MSILSFSVRCTRGGTRQSALFNIAQLSAAPLAIQLFSCRQARFVGFLTDLSVYKLLRILNRFLENVLRLY